MITNLAFLQCCTNQQIDNAFKKIFYAETIRFGTLKLVKKLAKKKGIGVTKFSTSKLLHFLKYMIRLQKSHGLQQNFKILRISLKYQCIY